MPVRVHHRLAAEIVAPLDQTCPVCHGPMIPVQGSDRWVCPRGC